MSDDPIWPGPGLRGQNGPRTPASPEALLGREDFEGHDAVESFLPRAIDRAHAALAHKFQDFECGNFGASSSTVGGTKPRRFGRRGIAGSRLASRGEGAVHQALRAQAQRRVGGQRPAATWTFQLCFHAFHPITTGTGGKGYSPPGEK